MIISFLERLLAQSVECLVENDHIYKTNKEYKLWKEKTFSNGLPILIELNYEWCVCFSMLRAKRAKKKINILFVSNAEML